MGSSKQREPPGPRASGPQVLCPGMRTVFNSTCLTILSLSKNLELQKDCVALLVSRAWLSLTSGFN